MKKELLIHLICTDFPGKSCLGMENIFLAVQKEKALLEETPADVQQKTFEIRVRYDIGKNGEPNFLGPYVFGKTGDKFLYLVWYNKVGEAREMFRRAKIKLNVLSWEQINQAIVRNQPLIANIILKDKVGLPVCASLKEGNISWEG